MAEVAFPAIITSVTTASNWKGDRAVEGNGLENRRAGNGTVGSNPTPSASLEQHVIIFKSLGVFVWQKQKDKGLY